MVGVNMSKRDDEAYVRGVRAAGVWKQLKHILTSWDQRCAIWAKNHNAPVWVGRFPLALAILVSLVGFITGGFVVALIVAFIWSIAFILQNIEFGNVQVDEQPYDKKNDLYDEFTMNSTINNEYDGAPYRSPSED